MPINALEPITKRRVLSGPEPKKRFLNGAKTLAEAVGSTIGPNGSCAVIDYDGLPRYTKDGVSVAKSIYFSDPVWNLAAQSIKHAAARTVAECGDGTTTSTVLAWGILEACSEQYLKGEGLRELIEEIRDAAELVQDELESQARAATAEDLENVAYIASNGDDEVADTITEAVEATGVGGQITVADTLLKETKLEKSSGYKIDQGFFRREFINDAGRAACVLERPLILIVNTEMVSLAHARHLVMWMEKALEQDRPFVLICRDLGGDCLATMLKNRADLPMLALKSPQIGVEDTALDDLAAVLGAKVGDPAQGDAFKSCEFGSALSLKSTSNETLFIYEENPLLDTHISTLEAELSRIDEESNAKNRLKARLAKLKGKVCVVRVGAESPIAAAELKDRYDDAVGAISAAQKYGVVKGGGFSYLKAREVLRESPTKGSQALYKALRAPNALIGVRDIGPDVIDPYWTVKCALDNAVGVACIMLNTNYFIVPA